ncbi:MULTISPECIES: 4'-phosphopantetheinyl transferase superfamily protein [Curtobacterium]|uniref:4'-phosphopantetheinyl transferase superfamily protein n=1 Tax=Curtobacterium TaxID=2034 RepID=UPI00217DCDA5|nr:4'-phosphopantetheinyl transferase superfamily protein [Curtobacterium flaccumfaciens]MCS6560959.1 4'-phosphopantetheinyl transferase superfamily protein [Curtobacterium flaccumfaciens pv. poinsettiae]UXN27899.1 4'-phosphopantetheinyl transferase superfamily protein [Curtobacterium flaccumfaciens]
MTLRTSAADRADDREALLAAVASATGVDPVAVRAGRVCPHCAGTDHGRPWATAAGVPVGVSLSRVPGVVALAVGPSALGVDVERVSRVAAAPLDVFTPDELRRADGDPALLAAAWAAKEAVLKRDGRGLRVDPIAVEVDVAAGTARFEGVERPLSVLYAAPDVVLVVAAGGLPVEVVGTVSGGA